MLLKFLIRLTIKPSAKNNTIIGLKGNRLLISIKADAKNGEANTMLIDYFSNYIHLDKQYLKILKGTKTANKTLSILCDKDKADFINEKLRIFSQIIPLLYSSE